MRKPMRGGRGGPGKGGAKPGSPMSGGMRRGAKPGGPMSGSPPMKSKPRFADDGPKRAKPQRMAAKMSKGNANVGARSRAAPSPRANPGKPAGSMSAVGGGLGPVSGPYMREPRKLPRKPKRPPPYSVT